MGFEPTKRTYYLGYPLHAPNLPAGPFVHLDIASYKYAVFGGNGETHYASGGVSSILDSLQTIIGNILRFVD